MLIKNTTPRLIGTILDEKKVRLKPGNNDLRPEVWAKIKKFPAIAAMLENEELLEPKEKTPAAAPQVTSLDGFSEKDALRMVKETVDRDLLEVWATGEKRRKVSSAIDTQLKTVAPPAPKEDGGEKGDDEEKDDEPGSDELGGNGEG